MMQQVFRYSATLGRSHNLAFRRIILTTFECLKQPSEEVRKVCLFPFFEQVEPFAVLFDSLM